MTAGFRFTRHAQVSRVESLAEERLRMLQQSVLHSVDIQCRPVMFVVYVREKHMMRRK